MNPYYVIGGVGLVRGRIPGMQAAMIDAARAANEAIRTTAWQGSIDCRSINHVIRYGEEAKPDVEVRLNRRREEIEVATQVSLAETRRLASKPAALHALCREHVNAVLAELTRRFEFPQVRIDDLRAKE